MLAQFIYYIQKYFYEKKISNFFQNFFQFFSVFWTPFTNKKIFLHFWAKNNLLLYTRRATGPFDPPKMLFRGLNYKLSSKRPPVYTLTFWSPCNVGLSCVKIFHKVSTDSSYQDSKYLNNQHAEQSWSSQLKCYLHRKWNISVDGQKISCRPSEEINNDTGCPRTSA